MTPSLSTVGISFLHAYNAESRIEVGGKHQKQEQSLQDVRKAGIHACERCGGNDRAVLQETDEGGNDENDGCAELCEPCNDDTRPTHVVGNGSGEDACRSDLEGGGKSDECGREEDRAQYDAIDLHACIVRRADAVAYDADLVTLLGTLEVEINEHADHDRENDANVELEFFTDGNGGEACKIGKALEKHSA